MANARVELTVSLEDFAASLGRGDGTARTAPVVRTLEHLVHFELARCRDDVLKVRLSVPTLSERQLRRLPQVHQAATHQAWRDRGQSVKVGYTYWTPRLGERERASRPEGRRPD
jgi:hypothetical protein